MRYKFKYTSDTIDQMTRWELDIEMAMIASDIEKENMARRQSR